MQLAPTPYADFLKNFEETLANLFHSEVNIDQLSLERGLPPEVWRKIMAPTPLAVAIPAPFGGRGSLVKECLGILAAASYESLSLSLVFGINIALFLEPVAKYAYEEVKPEIFGRFLQNQNMGGLMITEPNYGSDALNMKTINSAVENGYNIKGTKHWQGLTGMADYWLIACRHETANSELSRDIDFFICDVTQDKQQIVVEELFDNLGLYMIPYGLNKLDIEVPRNYKLKPESTGIKMMLDILHRSRMQFPGMGMGFIHRLLDEAIAHCTNRVVGTAPLLALDQVQYSINRIQTAYTVSSAMCARSSKISGIEHNLAAEGLEANTMKAVVTDYMQESAQILVQLSGANGYRISHIGGRGIVDSRPFQIFEGSNEMLYSQIAELILRQMKKQKQMQLFDFLKNFELTAQSSLFFKSEINFTLDDILPQRKLVDLGKILGRIIATGYVLELANKGFRQDLVDNCIVSVRQEIAALVAAFKANNDIKVITDYAADSAWLQFV
ncbi:acyl-CoA dehydrogenase family protein [Adhaeribacter pallidiroseus]|uniref:Isovaleryl-CoA dehydrogenase n=1 Tax=Adhaeribacter pallidiroseus TaxID=2072847 RepID=A0A369QFR7_9BACT|nr:acyl-CoA dehydrogenase family protein [Adhaeribacter pallidiroseus]RDC63140.1 Isovaleryl-CoA dehydrogenase [Adhaeribacter pallidiroseus]